MTAGEVMHAGPRGHGGHARAVIVAAAVVQIPAQVGVVQTVLIQIHYKSNSC